MTESDPAFLSADTVWVNKVFNNLTPDERIAQLIMVSAYSNKDQVHIDEITKLIKDYKIGGLIFMQGGPVRQAQLTNQYQSLSKVPLFIAMDAEWGLSMRLDSTFNFPKQIVLGAIQDNTLIYKMGVEIARQCKRMGVHVNFAPVVDVNNNRNNPVIGFRSFGENKRNVASKGISYMKGMQDNGVLACAKHFPGHGDTDTDSHKSLPVINHSTQRLDTLEFFPFRELIKEGVGSMMVAHLYVPSLDATENLATTLSRVVVTEYLKNKLGFKGLIFTDALNMGGVTKYFQPGDVEVKALIAGNDVLLFPQDVPKAIQKIKEAIANGEISQKDIDDRCKKILKFKKWAGLDKYKPIDLANLQTDLNSSEATLLNRKLIENALTLVKNKDGLIPLKSLDTLKIASVVIGDPVNNSFQKTLTRYKKTDNYSLPKAPTAEECNALLKKLTPYNLVIISFHNTNQVISKNYGISTVAVDFTGKVAATKKVILDVFANPYSLKLFDDVKGIEAIVMSYFDTKVTNDLSAQLIFGGIPAKGKLPVTGSSKYPAGTGLLVEHAVRLKYGVPEELGINSAALYKIDSIANLAIKNGATPGCSVLLAKDGIVFYEKTFGYHTYDNIKTVDSCDLYDLASVTKITATTAALMRLCDEGKFSVDSTMGSYSHYLDSSVLNNLRIKDVLAHQAGLKAWIPFYKRTVKTDSIKNEIYSSLQSTDYPVKVSDNMYIHKNFRDSIFTRIANYPLRTKKDYQYSDLGFYLFYEMIENITGVTFDNYLDSVFYKKLGADRLCFNPLTRFDKSEIVPTENDTSFRDCLVHGYVHDYGAAMLGGVCGHAGLFSDANDLAKMMQMFLNGGEYGGEKYLSSKILNEFTACYNCPKNRRGLGFDKPQKKGEPGPVTSVVPKSSYGHSGFTGTFTWIDPENKIVYIFLSNRIYPDSENKKLIKDDVRANILDVVYNSILN
ncbi:MAG: hypothetical protein A2W91_05285 [Bacteroidetes bacterium GWF2_38_335]|nr:MAG: hypothetical protein A2W91_05285 [Bacteroidetes bacterium GWF2_38_335]OFY79838.1 MAG: hypothetical protein A2281_10135 [Bacteroidetes bacterium RIFOXYA12_FULL_38_20]HBS88144.1 serine hydrolase [Bacteroidales bacterium]